MSALLSPAAELAYNAIRSGVAVSRVDDLAILRVQGPDATTLINGAVAGNVDRLVENGILWSAILADDGEVDAEVQVYNDFGDYLVTCRANVLERVVNALEERSAGGVRIEDASGELAAIAIEGPDALNLPAAVLGPDVQGLSILRFGRCAVDGLEVLVSRIGYSGEFGYLLFVPRDRVEDIVDRVLAAAPGATRCGREAQDLVKLEMRSFNFALDVPRGETALEAGLHWMIDFRKSDYRGRDGVMAQKEAGLSRRLVCCAAQDAAAIEPGDELFDRDMCVGYVVNAAWSPGAGRSIALSYVDDEHAWVGVRLESQGLGQRVPVELVSAPFLITESTRRAMQ